jgi:hypothetical protein
MRYTRSAITQLKRCYKKVLIKCAFYIDIEYVFM